MKVSQLIIYPIKSLGGVSLPTSEITDRGLKFDRRWMLIDETGKFISQRTVSQLALLRVELKENSLRVFHVHSPDEFIDIPYYETGSLAIPVQIWDDSCSALHLGHKFDEWFSKKLEIECKLVYMPDDTQRLVTPPHRNKEEINSFSDSYPFLMIGESSLVDLNNRMAEDIPMNRFRPNIVFSGGESYLEDEMAHFTINNIHFYGIKLSSRCNLPTINQENASKGKEPVKTLSKYRRINNKIYFGQNLVHEGNGSINVGDLIEIKELKESLFKKITANG